MIISYAGNKKNHGTSCETITELIDLYPTLTGLCGLSEKQPAILQGKSLAGYIKENKPVKGKPYAYTISYGGEGASIRSPEWRYTRWGEDVVEGNEELYRHSTDPEETINLADDSDQQEILAQMRGIFESSREKARVKMVNHRE
jgi:arylsulfatase A-like enzyme